MSFQSVTGGTGRVLRFTHPGTVDDKTQAIVTSNVTFPTQNYSVTALWNHSMIDNTGHGRLFNIFGPDISGKSVVNAVEMVTLQYMKNAGTLSTVSGAYPNNGRAIDSAASGMNLLGASFIRGSRRYVQVNSTIDSGNTGIYSESYGWDSHSTFLSLVNGWSGEAVTEFDEIRACKTPRSQDWMSYEYLNYCDHSNYTTYGSEILL